MILSLKIKNYLSFKDETTFSFEATKDQHLEKHQVVTISPNVRITKLGIVYGANASGKSNLINAFEFLHNFWFYTTGSKDEETTVIPFLLDDTSKDKPTDFVLTFYIESKKHVYTLKITKKNVISETLYQYSTMRPTEIFSRRLNQNVSEIQFNPKLKINPIAKGEIEVKCLANMSLFAAYNKVNVHLTEMDDVIFWMKNQVLQAVLPNSGLTEFVKRLMIKDESKKSYILNFLNQADFNISNINIQLVDKEIDEDIITDLLKDNSLPQIIKEKIEKVHAISVPHASFSHKVMDSKGKILHFDLPEQLQSKGTIRTMGLSGVISQLIERNAFVAIDEIESSLHPRLVEFVIESFLKQSKKSQLLITTHYDGLLEEEDLLRNDNIWFTSKKKDGSTELYSLSDFKGVNRISSLQKAYKYGKFGAIPNI